MFNGASFNLEKAIDVLLQIRQILQLDSRMYPCLRTLTNFKKKSVHQKEEGMEL